MEHHNEGGKSYEQGQRDGYDEGYEAGVKDSNREKQALEDLLANYTRRLNQCERILGDIAMILSRDMTETPEASKPETTVYSRPECVFNYCPNLGICDQQNRCESPQRSEKVETSK